MPELSKLSYGNSKEDAFASKFSLQSNQGHNSCYLFSHISKPPDFDKQKAINLIELICLHFGNPYLKPKGQNWNPITDLEAHKWDPIRWHISPPFLVSPTFNIRVSELLQLPTIGHIVLPGDPRCSVPDIGKRCLLCDICPCMRTIWRKLFRVPVLQNYNHVSRFCTRTTRF